MGNGNHDDSNKRQYFELVQLDRRICSRFVPRQSTNEQRHLLRLVNIRRLLSAHIADSAECGFNFGNNDNEFNRNAFVERRGRWYKQCN